MPQPLVTGISPKEGYPGTKVTIRGDFLGKDETDLVSVIICGVDCTLRAKWEKENRITTYTGFCKGKGDIVIVTGSGGRGTSSVGFQGLVRKNVGPYEEISTWVDEDPKILLTGLKRTTVSELSHDNPLNISLEESSKYSSEFLDQEFPNSSIDIAKENFSSLRFLLENYQNSSFDSLRSGLDYMKKNIGSKTMNSTDNLLKTNISSFMDAIKIMKDIHWLSSIDKKNELTRPFELRLKDILNSAHKIYDDDLECKAHADSIRNSLQILDTYKSLIYFPQQVDKLLLMDDYDQIITSYKLAKMQLSKAEPATRKSVLFAQIKRDLDSKVKDVQKQILDKLVQFPSSPDEQKFLIENYNLINDSIESKNGSTIDAGWHCLVEEKNWFIQVMLECRDMHIADEKVSMVMKQSNDDKLSEAAKVHSMSQVPHERNRFIEELCQMFFDIFTDYWRLGTMYLNNTLSSSERDRTRRAADYYALIDQILVTFCNIVRAAFIPHTFDKSDKNSSHSLEWPIQQDAKIISQILPHCLKVCRMCAQQIFTLEVPSKNFECVQALIYDLRCECLVTLLSQPTREILATLGFEEDDWIVDRDLDAKNNSSLVTNLPSRFETKFCKALTLCREYVLEEKPGEKKLFSEAKFGEKIAKLLFGIVHAFLKRTSRFMTKEDHLPKSVHISQSKLLLYLYNNLNVCKKKSLPKVWKMLQELKFPAELFKLFEQAFKESRKNVKELQDSMLREYVKEAIDPLVASIEKNLYAGNFDFRDCSKPIVVRNFVKQIIMGLLNVHSELFLLNKALIQAVFNHAVGAVYAKILSLLVDVPNMCVNAAVQTYTDIFCMKETFKLYTSEESKDLGLKILKLIPTNGFESHKKLMTKLIGDFQKGMQPYLAVFQTEPPASDGAVIKLESI